MNGLKIVALEIIAQCNLHCAFCVRNSSYKNKERISTQQFQTFLSMIEAFDELPEIALTGGEPFMHPDLFSYCQMIDTGENRFSITTNGTIHSWETIEAIADIKGFKHYIVSLDSADEAVHNHIRKGTNSYQKTITFMKRMAEKKIPFSVNMTVNDKNYHTVNETIQLANQMNARDISVATVKPNGRGKACLSQSQRTEIARQILENKHLISDTFKLWATEVTFFLFDFKTYEQDIKKGERGSCSFGEETLHIQVNGDILGCTSCSEPLGNIFNQPKDYLKSQWISNPILNKVRSKEHLKGKCSKCNFKNFCGGCRCRAFGITGDLFESDPYCLLDINNNHLIEIT